MVYQRGGLVGGNHHAALVQQVKDVQRSSSQGKQAWIAHCRNDLGGIHDPNRHDVPTLRAFLEWWALEQNTITPSSELVLRVKRLQRSSAEGKQAWISYCDQHLGGIHDPSRHDPPSLEGFLHWWATETGEAEKAPPPPELVEKIKRLQRSSSEGKTAWISHCDTALGGVHDPSLHDAADLQAFLDWWANETGEIISGPPPADLVQKVKNLQRNSPEGKHAWTAHCEQNLEGIQDPNRHDAATLQDFLDWWETSPAESTPHHEPPPHELIERIKHLQRSNEAGKHAWVTYCQTTLNGIQDPSRHDAETLSTFLDWWSSQQSAVVPMNPNRSFQQPPKHVAVTSTTLSNPSPPSDFVRVGSRVSPSFKSAWLEYCRSMGNLPSDPTKCGDAILTEFADYVASLVQVDLAGQKYPSEPVAPTVIPQKRPPPVSVAEDRSQQPPAKKKVTMKKSIIEEIRRLNESATFATEIRLGAVAGQLSQLDETSALEVLSAVLCDIEEEPEIDPNERIVLRAKERLQAMA